MEQKGKLSAETKTALVGAATVAMWEGWPFKDQLLSTPGLGYDTEEGRRRIDAVLAHAEDDMAGAVREAKKYCEEEMKKDG